MLFREFASTSATGRRESPPSKGLKSATWSPMEKMDGVEELEPISCHEMQMHVPAQKTIADIARFPRATSTLNGQSV